MHRTPWLAVPLHVLSVALCSVAIAAHRELKGVQALGVAACALTFAICGLHLGAVGGITVTPDPTIALAAGTISGATLTVLIACVTALIMLTGRAATLMAALSTRDAEMDLRRRHEVLQEREVELSRQNVLFDVALSSLPHGLCIADADRRLIVCNKRFADIYGIPAELTKPGTPIKALADHCIASGIHAARDAQAYRDELLGPVTKATVKTHHLSGGRYILVSRRPMPDGGWIAVPEDITERRRLQETEREAKETLAAIFDAVPEAIVCVTADRRVMLWSSGAELIFGYVAEETVGQPFRLVPPEGKAEFDDMFERALAGETLRDLRVVCQRKDGSQVDISFSSAAMRGRDGTVRGIVYALDDLTEWEQLAARLEAQNELLKQREEKLKAQNEQLDTALASMVQGLAMYDADERLVLANARYLELLGLAPDEAAPGTTLSQIVACLSARGVYPGMDADTALQARRDMIGGRVRDGMLLTPGGGRVVSASVQSRPDGGWVVTLHDLSEQERMKKRLQEQNEQLDAALNNMSQGLTMFDAGQRLVVCNRRFGEIYGLTSEQTKPGTTLRQIVEQKVAKGVYEEPADVEALVAQLCQTSETHRLADGRLIYVTCQRTANGGYVVTHKEAGAREKLNAQLEQQHRLLKEHETKLQTQNDQLDAALNNMVQGLAMFDANERLVVANARYPELYGLSPEQVMPGTTLSEIVALRCAKGFYPGMSVEEVLREMRARNRGKAPTDQVRRSGNGRLLSVLVQPRPDGGWVTTVQDISEQEHLKRRLQEQNDQLDAAINNMPQGLAMFDADQRLIVCNRLYAQMYGLTPEQVKPGTTVREIFDYRMVNGFYHVKDTERFVASWASSFGNHSSRIQELADGRIISVSRSQTTDGGRVVTHEDITERQKLNAQLERQHQLLKAQEERLRVQNVQLDAALNNMAQGLAMFDVEHRVVIANNRYAELYNLTLDEVKPGTPLREIVERRIAKGQLPGRSADEIVKSMISRVTGKASQYTTRLFDGRYIVVSAKPMSDGYTVTTHQDITEQRRSEAKIVHMALHDALTGLPNRVLFNDRLQQALARAKRGEVVAIHLLDLDHFKNVNDTLGHPAGDKLLKAVTERLRGLVRETDIVARMGGDEFAIVQGTIPDAADAGVLARRVIDTVSHPYEIDGHQVVIGVSVGIAVGLTDGGTTDQLMRNADLALYRAKGDGRGVFCFFEPGMDAQIQERRAMEYDMRKALVSGQFELHYQPVVNLQSNKVCGLEALVRWRHPERGLVSPAQFIPLAEEIGFIVPLGEWVIRQACNTATRWPDDVKVAVNLSPVQFRNASLLQTVVNALAASGLPPRRLELEITETTLLQDGEVTLAMLYKLRELGVGIAMDDFGTGYSSLSYLQSFPFSRIKIDRSFVKDIGEGTGSLNIVRAVAALAKGLGMETTAEGVETQLQRDKVASEGCTEMQGYLFSKPLPAHEIERQFFPQLLDEVTEQPAADAKEPQPSAARAAAR
jgi:diguanylate cyclase (GGDEF)-like protein/PAS domain S-box-containing protein